MRTVPLLIAIALLGLALAEPTAQQPTKRDLAAAVHKAGESLSKIQLKSPFGMSAIPQGTHLFKAQQSATCDQAAFADATARALQACPSLSGLVSGTTTLVEFLPGFCGSECHKTLATELPKHFACLDSGSSAGFLIGFINGCALRPRCFSEGFVKTADALSKRCGSQIDAVTNFQNFSTAATTDARAACTGTCVTEMASMMRTYPECIQDDDGAVLPAPAMADLLEGLCQQENGEYCSVRMKGIGKLSCSSYSVCYNANSWCSTNSAYSYCGPAPTNDRLSSFCGSCVTTLQKNAAAFGDDADTVVGALNLFCSTANGGSYNNATNPYCYQSAMVAFSNLNNYYVTSNATVAAYCSGAGGRCVERIVGISADIGVSTAKKTFTSCLSNNGEYWFSSCKSSYESSLRSAADTRASATLVCAQNDNLDYCLARMSQLSNAYDSCSAYGTSQYVTQLQAAVTAAGCCMAYFNDWYRYDSTSWAASYLPPGTRVQPYFYYLSSSITPRYYTYTHDTRYSRNVIYRGEQPANNLVRCMGTASNTSAFWATVEGQCSTYLASPPNGSVPVMISWTRLSRNAAVKATIEQALRADVASTMGVAVSDVVNGHLMENAAATIYLRNESTLSRRQQSSTDHGATFQFSVDQPLAADATAAVTRLTSSVTAGTFVTPSAAAAVNTQCSECVDSRSDLLVKSAETPVAPQQTSPVATSSAGAVAIASAVAAAFALVAAL
jgi:hypothetical protein